MPQKRLFLLIVSLALVIFPFLGMLDAGYVSYQEYYNLTPSCQPPFRCATVLESPWVRIGSVPIFYLGFIFYTFFALLAIMQYLGVQKLDLIFKRVPLEHALLGMGIAGLVFASYMIILMSSIIQAWCLYCLLSAINCGVLFLLSTANYKLRQEQHGEYL